MDREKLKNFGHILKEIKHLEEEREQIWANYLAPKKLEGMPHVAGKISDPVSDLAQKEIDIDAKIDELINIKKDIEDTIKPLLPLERDIMRLRYIHELKWENVALELSYSEPHIKRIHKKILDKLSI